ncbi:stage V sporulation protein AB [Bacillus kwashiorkori]|uniref:stage V sporulation protein AB n=1 Tax=Bacillus kwashiorkori TaxID=1522318 RepID=UPI000785D638|nr:stage V sporulation protein AB [Bacillus kwashiorkori]
MGLKILLVIFVGIACGIAVGAGFVAFLAVLGIIPRLIQLTKTAKMLIYYELAAVLGVICGSLLGLLEPVFFLSKWLMMVVGISYGIFIGMLAAALTEVLNVFPILAKRIKLEERLLYLLMAFVFGKIFGSLFHWIYFVDL